jgi:uncharacterized membrane protein/protein-disulfide isomerase
MLTTAQRQIPMKCATGSDVMPGPFFLAGLPPVRLWLLRGVSVVALGISLYLLFVSISLRGPVGCGASSSCEQVLNSRWSTWLGLPVSAAGAAVYLVLLVATFFVRSGTSPTWRRRAWKGLALTSALAALAAIWFISVQFAAVGSLCKYCLAIHSCGVIAAGLVWTAIPIRRREASLLNLNDPAGMSQKTLLSCLALASIATGVLIAGPILFPAKAYQISVTHLGQNFAPARLSFDLSTTRPATAPVQSSDNSNITFVAGGRAIHLDPKKVPVIGSPTAKYFIVMLGDYTCGHCQVTHHTLDRLREQYGDEVAVVVLPTPLDPACDPYVPPGMQHLPQSCALARIALAVWRANPQMFPVMDQWLFSGNRFRQEDEARLFASKLVGASALEKAEADPRVAEMIRQDCDVYAACGLGAVPKLLFGSTNVSGTVNDERILFAPIEREWGIKPGRP